MGNFSVSHYARISPTPTGFKILYLLDLAEIPTFEMVRGAGADSSPEAIRKQVIERMPEWVRGLKVTANGQPVSLHPGKVQAWMAEGAASMPVVRVAVELSAAIAGTDIRLTYEDTNFTGRAGWKEIVVAPAAGIEILAGATGPDRSKALAEYPADSTAAPPQNLTATVEWRVTVPPMVSSVQPSPKPVLKSEDDRPALTPANAPSVPAAGGPVEKAPGTVQRGDFLSTLLSRNEIPFSLALLGLGAAFALGAVHAMSPGHGKTIVAAYLVGSRGTFQHAMFLGAIVTFTHTVSVFLLGLGTLFLSKYILPEKIVPWLGAISGLSIVMIGIALFRKRWMSLRRGHRHDHSHGHDHDHHDHHGHDHHHHHDHSHDHGHDHGDGHHHHHVPEGEVTLASLIALGVSGGLVPCPSALVLLLSSIAIGRTGYGLLLLVGFSLGLAVVLMAIGGLVLYAKHLLPSSAKLTESTAFRLVPVLSAAVIVCVGLLMTGASMGVFKPIGY